MLKTTLAAGALALSGGAFASSNWMYRVDFVLYPLLAAGLIAWDCRSAEWACLALAGIALFTFVEYWAHRILLHRFFFYGTHERHHTHPNEYVVFPIWYTPLFFAALFVALPVAVFAGFCIGYFWFQVWHHVLHHVDLTTWPRPVQRYAMWHLAHHRFDDCNFGITIPFWDVVFRTYRS